ncbi:MAG: hypothetical protein PHI66_00655 [Candidatus Pacebacteria bacterium]|nr:hypothetical protein [Candidatus Paceibacterota bacterium]
MKITQEAKAISNLGDYIIVKLDASVGSPNIWKFKKVSGTYAIDTYEKFAITSTSSGDGECALFLVDERTLGWDSTYIVWAGDGAIIDNNGSSLSSDIGSNYTSCCDDTSTINASCDIANPTSSNLSCNWDSCGISSGYTCAKNVFEANYGSSGWSDGDTSTNDSGYTSTSGVNLSISENAYKPKVDILCEGVWHRCEPSETSCGVYSGKSYACNNGDWTLCEGSTPNCVTGACVGATGIILSVNPVSSSIVPSDTESFNFQVVDSSGNPVSGASISVTKTTGSGTITNIDCPTNSTGYCEYEYSAPASTTTTTYQATATKDSQTSNTVTFSISVNSCTSELKIEFEEDSYDIGDTLQYEARIPQSTLGLDYYSVCLYKDGFSGTEWDDIMISSMTGPVMADSENTVTATESDVGTWIISLVNGIGCPSSPDGCMSSTIIVASETTTPSTPPSSTTEYQCTSDWAVTSSGTMVDECSNICTEGSCTGTSCPTGGTATCSTPEEACVCSGGGGSTPPSTPASFAVCATDSWFFCNTLAGTVDNIVDAGETMIQAILGLIGTIALLFLIIAGIMYMTAAGEEEKIKSAKKIITGAIIGLGISLLAFSLLQTIIGIL